MIELMKQQQLQKEAILEAYNKESYSIQKPFAILNP